MSKAEKFQKKDTFVCFVDSKKAFVTVNRDCLLFKLRNIGISGNFFLNRISSLYNNVNCAVRVNNFMTSFFPVALGVKQGCVLSPTLKVFKLWNRFKCDNTSNMCKKVQPGRLEKNRHGIIELYS